MSFLKKPFRKLKEKSSNTNGFTPNSVSTDSIPSKTEGISNTSFPAQPEPKINGTTNGHTPRSIALAFVGNGKTSMDSSGASTPERSESRRQSREIIDQQRKRRSTDKERVKAENKKRESMARIEDERFLQEGPPELTKLYRPYSMIMSKRWNNDDRLLFKNIDWKEMDGEKVTFRARIHTLRRMSAKLVFIVFRQQTITIQGVLQSFKDNDQVQDGEDNTGTISEQMVRSVEHYPPETIVAVNAKLRKAIKRVKNATIHDYELEVYEVHKISELSEHVPFTVYDAENINRDQEDRDDDDEDDDSSLTGLDSVGDTPRDTPRHSTDLSRMSVDQRTSVDQRMSVDKRTSVEQSRNSQDKLAGRGESSDMPTSDSTDKTAGSVDVYRTNRSLPQRVRLNNRIIDLRTGPTQAIFRIQSGICNLFRTFLDGQGFIEIHTPKLQGGATESGATVFELNYFGRSAFLAQSPQLAKQMAVAADFERVYEVGPVFRAEDSNTPRHLTEFTGLDLEMALESHYHEALNVIDGMFKNLWKGIYERYSDEIELISQFYPHERVTWLEETPRIPFKEGVQMLKDDGWVDDDGNPPSEFEDLATRAEIRLGALVREKYKTDYYILDKFPASARPFYTMPDPDDDRFTNSFDIFMRGQEILSGGQRIHDAKFLEKKMKKKGMKLDSMTDYLEGFRWGAPPHAGCGIGLERLTYLFLNLGNIRLASMFPRDPKSFPAKPPVLLLHHEEASTTNPPWEQDDFAEEDGESNGDRESQLQPLEKLIANYGDAANTSWLDERFHVWRHEGTGAAQGYVVSGNYAVIVGNPLCAKSQYPQVIGAFLQFLKDQPKELKPLWLICGPEVEEHLGEKYNWRTIDCCAEERADPRNNPVAKDKDLGRKIRHAESEGVKEVELPPNEPIPDELKQKIDARIQDWQNKRKGRGSQVHLTEIRPWVDQEHRRYFYSHTPSDGTIHALVVLHQLSPQNGYQIKFQNEFPGAPSGTIESLILHAMKSIVAADPDVKTVTFGTGAMATLEGGRNMGKMRVKTLKKAYETIVKQFKLRNKVEFREKMGVFDDPAFVCYPRNGLGPAGIKAIMAFLEDEG